MENIEELPLYIKALELQKLVETIMEVVADSELLYETDEEGLLIEQSINFLLENSLIIPVTLKSAYDEDAVYDVKMECATLIRKAGIELTVDADNLEDFGFKHVEYLDILQNEIDEFRVLFAEWVKTIDPSDYTIDRWGLFNPPGINYDDYDPDDDDFPFGTNDLFGDD
ncbi:hypothetical protein [Psychroserpens sp. Hel_I_66]|uniref:hypothetical protein n=1 Tax=Psychroserpens sp. Hel_I_66 TaxID=1250004 RepID=UPI000647CF20|nr:hypothetical protein [Psychroserpens sp. Hel_I_66]